MQRLTNPPFPRSDVRCAAKSFIRLGLRPHEAVAIFGFNAPEWSISALGAIFSGGFSCGLYPTNSAEANKFIMGDAGAAVLVCEDDKAVDKMWDARGESIKKVRLLLQEKVSGKVVPRPS